MFTCDSCRGAFSGTGRSSVTGRTLCATCSDTLLGAAAGVVAAGDGGIGQAVPQGIATGGVFAWLRRWRRRG